MNPTRSRRALETSSRGDVNRFRTGSSGPSSSSPSQLEVLGSLDGDLVQKFFVSFFDEKLQFTLLWRAFSPPNITSSTSKDDIFNCYLFSGPFLPSWIRTRIQGPHLIGIQSGSTTNFFDILSYVVKFNLLLNFRASFWLASF